MLTTFEPLSESLLCYTININLVIMLHYMIESLHISIESLKIYIEMGKAILYIIQIHIRYERYRRVIGFQRSI